MAHCIALGADVNSVLDGEHRTTALHCASARGHVQAVEFLLLWNADVNVLDAQHCTAIDLAMISNHLNVLDLFYRRLER